MYIAERFSLSAELTDSVEMMSHLLPFRVNEYVLETMIDWSNVPGDPMFQLLFPQVEMLPSDAADELRRLKAQGWPSAETRTAVRGLRQAMNPHPSGQMELNVPMDEADSPIPGLQHKYRETVLYFPSQGQSCHAYCTYCFRWAQFVGDSELKFAAPDTAELCNYLRAHPQVTDVLITGGDPLMMSTERLESHIRPLLEIPSVETIRVGTKALAYWPRRLVADDDADDLLRLFELIVDSGRTCAVMAHVSHPRELDPDVAQVAIGRLHSTGARVFCQAPLIAHVNDDARTWARMWATQLRLGAVPYYMFVERDTGPSEYFKVPLARAARIFGDAYRTLPGLARTVRGPVMSATPGKIVVDGTVEASGPDGAADGRRLALRFLQARDTGVVGKPFTARDPGEAGWVSDLDTFEAPSDVLAALGGAPRRPRLTLTASSP